MQLQLQRLQFKRIIACRLQSLCECRLKFAFLARLPLSLLSKGVIRSIGVYHLFFHTVLPSNSALNLRCCILHRTDFFLV